MMMYVGVIVCLLAAGVWWFFNMRVIRLARAYTYLRILARAGSTPESSNRIALSIDMYAANQMKPTTTSHVNDVYQGSQPALLADAKSKGFHG